MCSYQFNFNMMTSRLPNKINNNFSKQKLSSQLDYQASSTNNSVEDIFLRKSSDKSSTKFDTQI